MLRSLGTSVCLSFSSRLQFISMYLLFTLSPKTGCLVMRIKQLIIHSKLSKMNTTSLRETIYSDSLGEYHTLILLLFYVLLPFFPARARAKAFETRSCASSCCLSACAISACVSSRDCFRGSSLISMSPAGVLADLVRCL